jgi:hypothetical protein
MYSEVDARHFTTLVYSVLLSAGKSVLKMKPTLWKNSLIVAKDIGIIHVNFIVIVHDFIKVTDLVFYEQYKL